MNIASVPSDIQEKKLEVWLTAYGDEYGGWNLTAEAARFYT